MASTIPYNLQFSSYANFRNPNFQRLQQMLGTVKAPNYTAIDIAAKQASQQMDIFQQGLAEQKRASKVQAALDQSRIDVMLQQLGLQQQQFGVSKTTSGLQQQRLQQEIDNLTAYYQALTPQYAQMFQQPGQGPAPTTAPTPAPRRPTAPSGGYSVISPKGITRFRT